MDTGLSDAGLRITCGMDEAMEQRQDNFEFLILNFELPDVTKVWEIDTHIDTQFILAGENFDD